MSMRQGLHMSQRLGLTQTLTPQMRMNLELIQAPILEAVQSLEQQVMVNPWLERNEEVTDPRFIRDADRRRRAPDRPRRRPISRRPRPGSTRSPPRPGRTRSSRPTRPPA